MTSPSTPAPRRPIETTVPGSGTAPPGAAGFVPFPKEKLSTMTKPLGPPVAITLIFAAESLM